MGQGSISAPKQREKSRVKTQCRNMKNFLNITEQSRLVNSYCLWWAGGRELDVDFGHGQRAITARYGILNNGPKDTQTLIPGTVMLLYMAHVTWQT